MKMVKSVKTNCSGKLETEGTWILNWHSQIWAHVSLLRQKDPVYMRLSMDIVLRSQYSAPCISR